ncbi:hypothetical protein [Vannielia litorea]|uniref:Uncharacterized protein n=1 Tax=Vannielia litorea TaxID=1217970 RepID=A0A1N6FAD9_9RHOB|nr:hypothetical protein [Vannielia litorea]SIN92229.1 hypothetical protein SAMN05444002_1511 [Vannielia litorea]
MKGPLAAALLAWAGGASGQGVPHPAWVFHSEVIQPEGRALCLMTAEGEGWNWLTLEIDGGAPRLTLRLHAPPPEGPLTLVFAFPQGEVLGLNGTVAGDTWSAPVASAEELFRFATSLGTDQNMRLEVHGPVTDRFPTLMAADALRRLQACAP